MEIVIVGIDLGKNSCSLAGLDASGRVVLRRQMRRSAVGSFVTSLRRCVVAMEACCGAHHLGRVFAAVRLMSPEYVRPLCEGTEERRSGRRGDRGGGQPADDAVC
jgi:transposase